MMSRNLIVGVLISVAAVILFGAVLMIGQEQAMFTPKNEYTVLLPNAEGLQTGSPVKLVGVQVGVITAIRLPETSEQRDLRVTLSVNRAYADRIRADSQAKVRMLTLLSGDRYLELSLGSPEEPVLPPGAEIRAVFEYQELFAQGSNIANDLAAITATLRVVFDKIQRQEGVLGRLLMDPSFGQDTMEDVRETLASVRRITAQVERGDGLAGALISDRDLRERFVEGFTDLTAKLNRVLDAAQDPDTAIGSLLTEEGDGAEVMDDVRRAADALQRVAQRLEDGDGMLGRLLADPEYADRVLGDLEAALRHTASITGKIDRGEGTLGGLVNDPALYQGVRDVVTGIQESRLLRWMVQRYGRKGAEAREKKSDGP
jgi:phospholipid/cholesterol/gamma-HCH transport system substrate-binding protein